MVDEIQPSDLELKIVADRCSLQTEQFFRGDETDDRYCYEMFRRAIIDRSGEAWEFVYRQYESLVKRWVYRHPSFNRELEDAAYFVNLAFARMWSAVTAEKFGRFGNLKALLRYLQLCVHSSIVDYTRVSVQQQLDIDDESLQGVLADKRDAVERQTLAEMESAEFWAEISNRLNSEKERVVVYQSYMLAVKPRELYESMPEMFDSVKEIYRIKENILARLRRDQLLRDSLVELTGKADR